MQNLLIFIQHYMAEMAEYIRMAEKSLANAPKSGHLRIVTHRGKKKGFRTQFFLVTERGTHNGRYLRKDEIPLVKQLARRDYDQKVLRKAKKFSKALDNFRQEILFYMKESCGEIFVSHPIKRALANPYILSDEEYAENWENQPYKGKSISDDVPPVFTEKGEQVRSKSEKMIADKLAQLKIPYSYERPLYLKNLNQTFYPDFTLLDVKNRSEIILEHFGMMDDTDYSETTVNKLNHYINEGFIPGRNLLFTMETKDHPLDTRHLEKILKAAALA